VYDVYVKINLEIDTMETVTPLLEENYFCVCPNAAALQGRRVD
jgi:hypothetical protein